MKTSSVLENAAGGMLLYLDVMLGSEWVNCPGGLCMASRPFLKSTPLY